MALAWFISFPTTDGFLFVAVDAPMRTTESNDFRFVDGTESSCNFDSLVEEAMKFSPKEKKIYSLSEKEENLLRMTCQLLSGDSPADVKATCEVLSVRKDSSAEVKLRQM